jgi:CelD/BcsL family acetyltransferase involved in cellulose biosynthesis
LNFDYDDCIWGYNSGTSEKHQQIAPGIISLGYSLEVAIDSRHRVYDLMRGDESYKYDYGAINRYVMRVQISRP